MARLGLRHRTQLALRVFRDGLPPFRMQTKKSPFRWPEHRRGQAQYHLLNFENYVQE